MTLNASIVRGEDGVSACRLTTDNRYDLPYEALLASANPLNWPLIQPKRFLRMIPLGLNSDGWFRAIEHGLGNWGLKHRTPLKFWNELLEPGYRVNYELDTECDPRRCDPYIYVDYGYLWVVPEKTGVRVRTSKTFAIQGISPLVSYHVLPRLGWEREGVEFFHNAATVSSPLPFQPSQRVTSV